MSRDCPLLSCDQPILARDCPLLSCDQPILSHDCTLLSCEPLLSRDCPLLSCDQPILSCDCVFVGLVLGFSSPSYTVHEGAGVAMVQVDVRHFPPAIDVTFQIITYFSRPGELGKCLLANEHIVSLS